MDTTQTNWNILSGIWNRKRYVLIRHRRKKTTKKTKNFLMETFSYDKTCYSRFFFHIFFVNKMMMMMFTTSLRHNMASSMWPVPWYPEIGDLEIARNR